ncbi:TPA: hypothetical protein QDA79_006212, partial [Burkholderia territorii]|nr:hypothetical protein [Burkholderia territorii]
ARSVPRAVVAPAVVPVSPPAPAVAARNERNERDGAPRHAAPARKPAAATPAPALASAGADDWETF